MWLNMQTIFLLFWLWHLILLSWHILFLVSFATFCHHHNCSSFNISWHSWKGPIYWCSFGSSLVSLEVFSAAQILLIVQTQLYVTWLFLSPFFLFFFILEFKNCFYQFRLLFLYSFLLSILFSFQICCPFISLFQLLYPVCFSHVLLLFNLFSFFLSFIFLEPSI